ncbi:MAG TPA: DUF2852 domain-containing protein [Dongiaceae bacterium]
MDIAARLDDIGKPAWIALMVLGFIFIWPVGLMILAYLIWSRRMGCWKRGSDEWRSARERWREHCGGKSWRRQESSGNTAFDEYRADTLRRLEEEQKEFFDFLDRLRQAKDKAEFDQFMNDRRNRQQGPDNPEPQAQA